MLTYLIVNTEDVTREQQTLSAAVSRVSSASALLQTIPNAEMGYTEEELLKISGFTSAFICAPLRQISNDVQQRIYIQESPLRFLTLQYHMLQLCSSNKIF